MPLGKKWRSLDFFGSLENLHLPSYHHHKHKDKHGGEHKDKHSGEHKKHYDVSRKLSEGNEHSHGLFRPRLSSLSSVSEQQKGAGGGVEPRRDSDSSDGPAPPTTGMVQRCVIIQKDERGYGLTVSGDNPVYVASIKPEGAAARAGVQKHDRIVKVNGTLVTNKNHTDVVRLIKSGAYVALTLMGKPNSATSPGGNQPPSSPSLTEATNAPSNRNSRITAPQPVAPDKDRELLLQKMHMTQAMFEQAKEDFQRHQKQYVKSPTEKLHTQLLEKERTVKTLENQLRQLTGGDEPLTPSASQGSQRFSDMDQISNADSASLNSWSYSSLSCSLTVQQQQQHHHHHSLQSGVQHFKQASVPLAFRRSQQQGGRGGSGGVSVTRSKSDAASSRPLLRPRATAAQSTLNVAGLLGFGASSASAAAGACDGSEWKSYCSSLYHRQGEFSMMVQPPPLQTLPALQATSLPVSDLGSMSDSPLTSPSNSPTPVHPDNRFTTTDDSNSLSSRTDSAIGDCMSMQTEQIITIDDEDVNSDDDQTVDTGPFSDIHLLEKKPAHMAVFLHFLISNSDPSPFFFYIVTDAYKQAVANTKDLRKWGYEIFSTFLAPCGPLRVGVSEALVVQVSDTLVAGATRTDNEATLRSMFDAVRAALSSEVAEQLADFRNKRDLGLGNIFGVHELKENMDKSSEQKMMEKYLTPHLMHCTQEGAGRKLSDRDQAMGWALATFFRQVGVTKTSAPPLERVQSFIMKDKRGFKIPGSRTSKTKSVKSHQFNLQHFYVPTLCSKCEGMIWGVGYQGFLCQSCEMGVHKQCVEEVGESCIGKKRGKRASAFIPVISASRKISNPNPQAGERCYSVSEALGQALSGENKSPPYTSGDLAGVAMTQPLRKEDESDFAGLPTEHSVMSIVSRYQELTSTPTGSGPVDGDDVTGSRKASIDLSRSESLKGKGDKSERPARRAKSDVDKDDTFRALNQQSGSSSASSLSNRSMESPSTSSEHVSDALTSAKVPDNDSDLEVDELPSLKQVVGEEVLQKLKPKEKKRQEVINELFHTEKAHLRNLKVLDLLFYGPMVGTEGRVFLPDVARALFPNIEEVIRHHASMNKRMKDRRSQNPVVGDVGDILLERFDGKGGVEFRKACAEYCRNQAFALEALKKHRRKDQRFAQFLTETEADRLCRKLELKDHVPCQMQRLTKYPMLIENLMRYSQNNSEEYKNLERALERSKYILAYVNTAVRECENYHKLKDMQKKLDKRAIDASAEPSLMEIKKLDLTDHKLVYDGPLVWRLRSHRQMELHVLLLEDILVLLQRVDDRLVLKCQSTNLQTIGDYKYTHSPVLKLQNLLARNVATDKKAFYVINTSDTGPQIYELVAQTQEASKKWCRLINEKSAEHVKLLSNAKVPAAAPRKSTPSPEREEMVQVRRQILAKTPSPRVPTPPPAPPAEDMEGEDREEEDTVDGSAFPFATPDYQPELIQPDQVDVSKPVTGEAMSVLSPQERLRRTDQVISQALEEKEQIVAEMLHLSINEFQHFAQQHQWQRRPWEAWESDENSLVASCMQTNNRLLQLIAQRTSSLLSEPRLQGHDLGPGSGSGSDVIPPSSESGPSLLKQELLTKGASAEVQVPMDKLKGMASEMNSMLSNLLSVMGTKGEERKSMRLELKAAQDQLDMLKAVQRQMMSQQQSTPSTPGQSRPHSFVSTASSVSEGGETTDSDRQDDEGQLKVAQTQEVVEETIQQLTPSIVHPQVVAASQALDIDDSDDDACEMTAVDDLPLPDDSSMRAEDSASVRTGSAEPMTTDLDEGEGEEEGGRVTPTPSLTSMDTVTTAAGEDEEREWDRGSVSTLCDPQQVKSDSDGVNNNNTSAGGGGGRDSQLTNPIHI